MYLFSMLLRLQTVSIFTSFAEVSYKQAFQAEQIKVSSAILE